MDTKPTIETVLERINTLGENLSQQINSVKDELNGRIDLLKDYFNERINGCRDRWMKSARHLMTITPRFGT
jgi:archaellum component FlaC